VELVTRVLPRAEYGRLVGTELACLAATAPEGYQVLVVEAGDQIVACWALVSILHVEGVWVSPQHRIASRHLLRGMADLVADAGGAAVLTGAADPKVARLLKGLGATKLDFDHYVVSLERWLTPETPCPQR
jgi:hypothetical protein